MALTPKQEHFCRCVASGMNSKAAYEKAYNTNAKDTVKANEAYKLMLNEEIQQRIKALIKPLEEATRLDNLSARDKQIAFIEQRIEICKEKQDEQSIIRYTDMLNKIYGTYKEQNDTNINNNDISKVSTDTLLKLVSNE